MASTTISGSGTRNNSGTAVGISSTSVLTGLSVMNTASNSAVTGSEAKMFARTGVESILRSAAVAITAITQSGSTGKINVQKSSHGLVVGGKIMIGGADVAAYNRVGTVLTVTDANNVKLDIPYTTDTVSVHGNYYTVSGNFSKQTAGKYVAKIVTTELAGIANTTLLGGGYVGAGSSVAPFARGSRRSNITSWDYTTGAATYGANRGDLVKYHNISANVDTLAVESYPSRAVPGRVTYQLGKNVAISATTPIITE